RAEAAAGNEVAAFPHADMSTRRRACGTLVPSTPLFRSTMGDGDEPEAGIGEICIRGENIMKGYWGKPDATAEAIDADGWFHSGRSEEHTSELQSREKLVCRLLREKKKGAGSGWTSD